MRSNAAQFYDETKQIQALDFDRLEKGDDNYSKNFPEKCEYLAVKKYAYELFKHITARHVNMIRKLIGHDKEISANDLVIIIMQKC